MAERDAENPDAQEIEQEAEAAAEADKEAAEQDEKELENNNEDENEILKTYRHLPPNVSIHASKRRRILSGKHGAIEDATPLASVTKCIGHGVR